MKQTLLFLVLIVIVNISDAQTTQRHISFRSFDRNSVNLSLDDNYYLIEDSCKQITRYSRFDFKQRKFHGKFTDVSNANQGLIVSEGTYTIDGLKSGEFISHYLNGNLQAKGNFKNDKYDGAWEVYYGDGKPEVSFEVKEGVCRILNAWGTDEKKIVDNGNGTFMISLGQLYWKGKLLNGRPDGTWRLFNVDDISKTPLASEYFKKGMFHDGSHGTVDYTDASHIDFDMPVKLPFMNAETMSISPVACDGSRQVHIVNAQYRDGLNSFSNYIGLAVSPYFSQHDLRGMEMTIAINGEIADDGNLINLKNSDGANESLARQIIIRLADLPRLQPATVNGKPVKQKFTIFFTITNGFYKFTYQFLPIKVSQ